MITIGLTGGIGSGKSTVLEVWKSIGAYVVRADALAKKLMRQDEKLKQQIIKAFGHSAYDQKGHLNRAYLSREAFEKGRVEELNNLVHPRVQQVVKQKRKATEDQDYKAFVYEAALLLNNGRPDYLDRVVLVTAPENDRIKWVANRDDIAPQQVKDRMKQQLSESDMKPLADHIIQNNSTLRQLKQQAASLFKNMLRDQGKNC